ncbi:MAG TPA: hypothetical protein VMT86_11905 [Bryobacteraceae bacterium]|nr:hypothetical protein [Bryobacteraceae bacterium]
MRVSGQGQRFGGGKGPSPEGILCVVTLAVALTGCTLGSAKQPATPPPPAAAAAQATPEGPLSIPQTTVVLPSPQPVNPDAIPKIPAAAAPAPEKAETAAPAPRTPRRAAAPKPEQETEADNQPAAPVAAPPEQPPIQPILSPDEQKRIKTAIDGRRREIQDWLNKAKSHQTKQNQSLTDRINSFLTQEQEAEQRGDLTQADALSERAMVLARELQVD